MSDIIKAPLRRYSYTATHYHDKHAKMLPYGGFVQAYDIDEGYRLVREELEPQIAYENDLSIHSVSLYDLLLKPCGWDED